MKASRSSQEKSQHKVHRMRLTFSSTDSKQLERVYANIVRGSQNKRLKVDADEVDPVNMLPVNSETPHLKGMDHPPKREGRASKKGCTNFRWSPGMSRFLLRFLVDQVGQGQKVNKSFKRQALIAAAKAVREKFRLVCSDSNVENHLRTLKTRYAQIMKLRSLNNTTWDEDDKKIIMDAASYGQHIMAYPKDEPFINKRIELYDEMMITCGDEEVSPRVVANLIVKENAISDAAISGDDMTPLMADNIKIEEEPEGTHSKSQEVSASSDSTGRTRQNDQNTRYLADKIDNLAFQIGQLAEALKSNQKGISLELFEEVMKSEGYNETLLGKAFDYLNEHESLARGFLAKNYNLRHAWLTDFFSTGNGHF